MKINRRTILRGAALAAAVPAAARAADPAPAPPPAPKPTVDERVQARAREARYRMAFDGQAFSGPGWDHLVGEGHKAQFFLFGEEHGYAEGARLAKALIGALAPSGYSRLAVEISPPMAAEIDRVVAAGGVPGLKTYFQDQKGFVAFYTLTEEAEVLAAARQAFGGHGEVIWGLDYEVGADRRLIERLQAKPKPAAAAQALAVLAAASAASWAKFRETHNPALIYSFAGDPALVESLRAAWPRADAEAVWIMDTLRSTFEINRFWVQNKGYDSNVARSQFMRANLLRYWRAEKAKGRTPKVFFKLGGSHVMRGLSLSDVFDFGTLVPEMAALEGGESFNVLVTGGAGSHHAVFNPVQFQYASTPIDPDDEYYFGQFVSQAFSEGCTVFDLRAVRSVLVGGRVKATDPNLVRIVHGFDAMVVVPGAHASTPLV